MSTLKIKKGDTVRVIAGADKDKEGKRVRKQLEVDFVVNQGSQRYYIQVAYEITDRNREREFNNFAAIRDNYPKLVISRDKIPLSEKGIIHRNIIDFLLDR